jgi:hypothetical protein
MADPPPYPDTGNDTGVGSGRGSTTTTPVYPGTPRWVKVSGVVVLVLVLLFVITMFAGGGRHGPGRHMPSGGAGGYTSPIAHGVQWL